MTDLTDNERRLKALDAARRAVQFLESGQATGAFIAITDEEKVLMWDAHISAYAHPIGEAALVLAEAGARLRKAWYSLIEKSGDGGSFLAPVENEEE